MRYFRKTLSSLRQRPAWVCVAAVAGAAVLTAVITVIILGVRVPVHPEDVTVPDWITQDFITPNPYSRSGKPLKLVNGIVVHYIGNPGTSAAANRNYFNNLAKQTTTYASSHFIIGLDGEIIQCVPLSEIAYASNNRNSDTISIECCHPDDTGKFYDATYASLIKLVTWLCEEFNLNENDLLRHYDVTGKECPRHFVRNPSAWDAFREDIRNEL